MRCSCSGDQSFSSEEQLDFATRLDGELHRKTGIGVLLKSRFGDEALTDVSNVDAGGEVLESNSRKAPVRSREPPLGTPTRRFRTRAAATRCSPPSWCPRFRPTQSSPTCGPPTTRWQDEIKTSLEGLRVHHSIAYSRVTLGFEFSEEESDRLKGAILPLVLNNSRTGRRSLYLALARVADTRPARPGWPAPAPRPH